MLLQPPSSYIAGPINIIQSTPSHCSQSMRASDFPCYRGGSQSVIVCSSVIDSRTYLSPVPADLQQYIYINPFFHTR